MKKRPQRGFIALMSALIVSAILLVVVVAGSMTGFTVRFNQLDAEAKERGGALVDACVDTLLSRIAVDSTYLGPEVVAVGSDSCQILGSTNGAGNPRTFMVQAVYQNSYTNALVTVQVNSLQATAWQEVGNF